MLRIFSFCAASPDAQITRWATYASVSVAFVLIVLKTIAWGLTHSLSLQASLIDSVLDLIASVVNLVVVRTSMRPPDFLHRFGHEKAESLAALLQSVFIAASAGWLLLQVFERVFVPIPIQETAVGLQVMALSIFLTLFLVAYQDYVIQRTKNEAITADRLHYYSDLLTNSSVFVSLCLVNFFSIEWLDPLLGGFIALYILKTSWTIARRAVDILMDHEIPGKERQAIQEIISSFSEITQIKDFRTRAAGTKLFIQGHVVVQSHLSLTETCLLLQDIKKKISRAYPRAEIILQPILHQIPPNR